MSNENSQSTETLIEFPSAFPLKIFGEQHVDFAQTMLEIVTKHDPQFVAANMDMRASKTARYISLTCNIWATSKPQLDALYQELCDHPMVKVVL